MRVSDQMLFDLATRSNAQAESQVLQATQTVSSGLRVQHPWDDPTAAGILAQSQVTQARLSGIAATAQRAADELTGADSALSQVSNVLSSAAQLAVRMANSTYSASDRAIAGGQVDQYLEEIVAALNTKVGDRYVFGGNKDGSPPFDASGNYLGDAAVRQVEIAPGVTTAASVRADVAMKGAGGGTDVLAALQSLSSALKANDTAGIQSAITSMNQGVSQVSAARGQIGDSMNALDTAAAANQAAVTAEKTRASSLADADIAQSATALAQAQQALQASLTATAQSFQLTLLNFLK